MKTSTCFMLLLGLVLSCGDDPTDIRTAFLGNWTYSFVKDCSSGDLSGTMSLEITKSGNTKILLSSIGLEFEATVIEKDFALASGGYTGSIELIDGTLNFAIYQDIVCYWSGTATK